MDLHLNNLFDRFQEQLGPTSREKKKKKQQKQTKPNADKWATAAGPLRTKRKPINK